MSAITLEAEVRTDMGKGASRRLRRLENKVPAVVYGGDKAAKSVYLWHNKVLKALETESIYSSVLELKIGGKSEQVILKDLQRHPYKPFILHMDLQRVSAKDVLVKMIPLHFINAEEAAGVKEGGIVSHTMTQVEVKCQVKDLPAFIEIDLKDMALDDVIHLSSLKLPKGVKLAVDPTEGGHDHAVVTIHMPRVVVEEEVVVDVVEEGEEGEEAAASQEPTEGEAKPDAESEKPSEA